MKKTILRLALISSLAATFGSGFAQTNPVTADKTAPSPTISINSNGSDVRTVLHDLFLSAKENFVLDSDVHGTLYLSLDKISFEEAFAIICHQCKLKSNKENSIYYISNDKPPVIVAPVKASKRAIETSAAQRFASNSSSVDVLTTKKVSVRLYKTDIRKVFKTISDEAGVEIDVDDSIPNYRLDASLFKVSLKYALQQITGAASLKYKLTSTGAILIYSPENQVSIVSN